ncbi:MAG: DUF92 domain-containing protein [Candidatus Diapherotrites archaeon]|nr:DUF92 domain-containing protein [Candidatus Micrarchaeota archaeon]
MDPVMGELALLLGLLAVFSAISYVKNSLTNKGIIISNVLGIVVYRLGGMESFLVLIVFFIIAESCTRYARAKTGEVHERRTTSNIFGNAGAAVVALALGAHLAFFGSIASALADTVSSEIGMLSRRKPRLITTLEEVEHGTDGGVTILGLFAGALAAGVIGIIYFYINGNILVLPIMVFAGFAGSLIDSVLGAVFERGGKMNNMEVNFIASICGGGIAILLGAIFL